MKEDIDLKKVMSGEMINTHKSEKKKNHTYMKNEKEMQKGANVQNSNQNSKNSEKHGENAQNLKNEERKHNSKKSSEENRPKKIRALSGAVIGLTIATSILGATTLGLGIAYGVTQSQANHYGTQIENIYKKNYFELVDNVNNADMKISKLLASNNDDFQAKMLTEISQASFDAQNNVAALPLSNENILESVRFINQMSGYTQTLEEKLAKGGSLTESDLKTLRDMHESLTEMKRYLNRMSQKMFEGYSILEASSRMEGDYDAFSIDFAQIKADDTDYPSMIYDGPFSDSVVNAQVKGLSGNEVSKEEAYKKVDEVFKNIDSLRYDEQTDGKFATYNFTLTTSDDQKLYVQVTKIGGNILTVSGNLDSDKRNIDMARAEKIALDFAKANGIKDGEIVWKEELKSQAYFNITPKQNDIVLYPDLVKVKVDMEHGDVIGYDAISYFTNHTGRNLTVGGIGIDLARERVDKSFEVKGQRLVLAPLDYNREVLCYEFEAERDGATYYLYFNASTGVQENILKVVKTSDSSKLM